MWPKILANIFASDSPGWYQCTAGGQCMDKNWSVTSYELENSLELQISWQASVNTVITAKQDLEQGDDGNISLSAKLQRLIQFRGKCCLFTQLGTRYIYDQNLFNFLIVCNFIIGISDACSTADIFKWSPSGHQVVTKLSTSGLPEVYRLPHTDWLKCFCIFRLKCSTTISGYGLGMKDLFYEHSSDKTPS